MCIIFANISLLWNIRKQSRLYFCVKQSLSSRDLVPIRSPTWLGTRRLQAAVSSSLHQKSVICKARMFCSDRGQFPRLAYCFHSFSDPDFDSSRLRHLFLISFVSLWSCNFHDQGVNWRSVIVFECRASHLRISHHCCNSYWAF